MAVEIQIRNSALVIAISRATQAQLYQKCLPRTANVFVDHMDVVESGITIADGPGPDIRMLVPIDVYLVPQASLMQSANEEPPGAKAPAGRLVAEYSLTVAGTSLSVTLADLRPEPPNPLLGPLLKQTKNSLPNLPPLNLASAFTALGLPAPTSSEILVLGNQVVIRFDPVGPAAPHLFPGQEWGLFIDGPGVVGFIRSQLPPLPLGAQLGPGWERSSRVRPRHRQATAA